MLTGLVKIILSIRSIAVRIISVEDVLLLTLTYLLPINQEKIPLNLLLFSTKVFLHLIASSSYFQAIIISSSHLISVSKLTTITCLLLYSIL